MESMILILCFVALILSAGALLLGFFLRYYLIRHVQKLKKTLNSLKESLECQINNFEKRIEEVEKNQRKKRHSFKEI